MGHIDYASGQWVDDDGPFTPPNPGSVGEQAGAPVDQGPPPSLAPVQEIPPPLPPQGTALPAPTAPTMPTPPAASPPPVPVFTPPPAPNVPLPPPVPRAPGTVESRVEMTPEEKQNLGNRGLTNLQRRENAGQAGQQTVQRATAAADQADAAKKLREDQAAEQANLYAAQQKVIAQRQADDAAEYTKWKGMGLKDPDADESFGHKLLSALAIGLGQYAATMTHTENQAAKIFEAARAQNLELQRAAIEKQKEASIHAGKDVTEARQEAADALHALQIKQLAQTEAFKDKFVAESQRMGIPDARIAATQTVLDLDKAAEDEKAKVLESGRTRIRDLTPKELAGPKAHGAGGGGGGGGAGLAELIKMKEDSRPDSEIAARAAELHIPPGGKSGYLQSIKDVRATEKQGLQGERQVSKEAQDWAKENGLGKIQQTQRELAATLKTIQDNAHNPLAQALAVEKAVSAARGGAASKQALALALEHLGGSLDNADAIISKIRSGELGPKQMENFTSFLRGQLGTAQQEGKNAYDAYDTFVQSQPPEKQAALQASRTRLFSGLEGFGGPKTAKPAGGGGLSPPADQKKAAASSIVNNPAMRSRYTAAEWAALIQTARGP